MPRRFTNRSGAYADEPALGLVLRRGHDGGLNTPRRLWRFLRVVGAEDIRQGRHLAAIADACGVDPAVLAHASPIDGPGRRTRVFGHDLPHGALHRLMRRWCPDCLSEAAYHRSAWDLTAMAHCVLHARPLEQSCPECRRTLHYDKLDLTRCHCRARLTRPTYEPVDEEALVVDRWLLGRIGNGPAVEDGLLAGLPLAEALMLCERLGAHSLHPTATYAEAWRRDEAAAIVSEGFGIASGGRPSLDAFLDRLIAHQPDRMSIGKRGASHWGAALAYGGFATWMRSATRNGGFAPIAAIAADHAERNVTLKTGSVVFGRTMHPKGTGLGKGSELAGLTYGRFRRLVRGMGHAPDGPLQGRPIRMAQTVAREIQARLADSVDCGGAAAVLGIHRSVAAEILASPDLFPASLDAERAARGEHTVERRALTRFLTGLEETARNVDRHIDARPVARASVAVGATLVDTLRWIADGKVPVAGLDEQAVGLQRILVRAHDIVRARMPSANGMTKKEAAERLGVKREAVRQLIELGFLRAETHSGVRWIRTEDVHAFEARFVRGPDVAARLGVHALSVPGRLARLGVEPAIGRDRCQMAFYERARIEAVLEALDKSERSLCLSRRTPRVSLQTGG